MTNALNIEEARIITLSSQHLHPDTQQAMADAGSFCGPMRKTSISFAMRDTGFLVPSHLGVDGALDRDLEDDIMEAFPDLVLVRALARGLKATWINIDNAGEVYDEILPSYDDRGTVQIPSGDGWNDCLGCTILNHRDNLVVAASREALMQIEAGQTPALAWVREDILEGMEP